MTEIKQLLLIMLCLASRASSIDQGMATAHLASIQRASLQVLGALPLLTYTQDTHSK